MVSARPADRLAGEEPLEEDLDDAVQALLSERSAKRQPARRSALLARLERRGAWLAFIGWGLWPVQWVDSGPWQLPPARQARYVALVAADLWRSRDAAQARADLAGWNTASLSAVMAPVEAESADPDTGRQLSALRAALATADAEPSLWAYLFSRRPIYWSSGLAAVLMTAALAVLLTPSRRRTDGDEADEGAEGGEHAAAHGHPHAHANAHTHADGNAHPDPDCNGHGPGQGFVGAGSGGLFAASWAGVGPALGRAPCLRLDGRVRARADRRDGAEMKDLGALKFSFRPGNACTRCWRPAPSLPSSSLTGSSWPSR